MIHNKKLMNMLRIFRKYLFSIPTAKLAVFFKFMGPARYRGQKARLLLWCSVFDAQQSPRNYFDADKSRNR